MMHIATVAVQCALYYTIGMRSLKATPINAFIALLLEQREGLPLMVHING